MPNNEHSDIPQPAWLMLGNNPPEYEDYLIGNREALELLRLKLDEALQHGESKIGNAHFDFVGIRVLEEDPRTIVPIKDGGIRDALGLLGCALAVFLLIFVFVAGLLQIWTWGV